ncbi:MAG: multiheme c-type cytochrome [Bryobacteraceae bacterium]
MAAVLLALTRVLSADTRCSACHAKVVISYEKTGMGRSISRPSKEVVPYQKFDHPVSGTKLSSAWSSGALLHKLMRNGQQSVYKTSWAVGSGNQCKSFLIEIGVALFQSPISWYSSRRSWDLSPGFESDSRPDFFRPVTADCMFCHAGMVRPRKGTLNRYLDPPFFPASIGCDRCHGDPAAHLLAPRKANIVNPSRLEPQRRDAVCEQCHLSGEARIPNPGKIFSDFRPGMVMEEVLVFT